MAKYQKSGEPTDPKKAKAPNPKFQGPFDLAKKKEEEKRKAIERAKARAAARRKR